MAFSRLDTKAQFELPRRAGRVGVLLVLLTLMDCAPQAVTYPQPGMAIWKNGAGGSIEGRATLRSGSSSHARNCAGLYAYIVPVTPETTAYVREHFGRTENGFAPTVSLQDTLGLFVTNSGGGRVECRGDGTFAFTGLAPGSYYVLADIKWLLRWAHEGGTVCTLTNVSATHSSSAVIDVSLDTHGGTSNVSQ